MPLLRSRRSLSHALSILALGIVAVACATDTPLAPTAAPATPQPSAPATPTSVLQVSRQDVVFNSAPGARPADTATIEVTAASAVTGLSATIRYSDDEPGGWLSATLDRTTAPAKLTLHSATTTLPLGSHGAVVTVAAAGGVTPVTIDVAAKIVQGPAIGLSNTKICFTPFEDPAADSRPDGAIITSVDGSPITGLTATVEYTAGQPAGWLRTRFDATTAPTKIWLTSTKGSLPPGDYTAKVLVASPDASNSPQVIDVTLQVRQQLPGFSTLVVLVDGPIVNGTIFGTHGILGPGTYSIPGVGPVHMFGDDGTGESFPLRWEGACTGTAARACTVLFDAPGSTDTVTVVYQWRPSYFQVLLRGTGAGGTVTGTISGTSTAVNCAHAGSTAETSCDYEIAAGVGTVMLTATPAPGSRFVGWDFECSGTDPTCSFEVTTGNSDHRALATFAVE